MNVQHIIRVPQDVAAIVSSVCAVEHTTAKAYLLDHINDQIMLLWREIREDPELIRGYIQEKRAERMFKKAYGCEQ